MDLSVQISIVAIALSLINIAFVIWWKRYEENEMKMVQTLRRSE